MNRTIVTILALFSVIAGYMGEPTIVDWLKTKKYLQHYKERDEKLTRNTQPVIQQNKNQNETNTIEPTPIEAPLSPSIESSNQIQTADQNSSLTTNSDENQNVEIIELASTDNVDQAPPPKPDLSELASQKYPLPLLPSIDEKLENWTSFPEKFFPIYTTAQKDISFSIVRSSGAGSIKIRRGRQVIVHDANLSRVQVAPNEQSSLRSWIPVSDTKFKQEVESYYQIYIYSRKNSTLAKRNRFIRNKADKPNDEPLPTIIGRCPKPDIRGRYPSVSRHLRNFPPKTFLGNSPSSWGIPFIHTFRKNLYWAIPFTVKLKNPFGTTYIDSLALARKGKIISFIYAGTEEKIP